MKKLIITLILFLLVLPLGYALNGVIAITSPSSVISGQQFESYLLGELRVDSILTGEQCGSGGCVIELDPWKYNNQPINYIDFNGNVVYLTQSIIDVGTASNSACDGNPYYASLKTPLSVGNTYNVNFNPKAPLQTGTWIYRINVYNACISNGGSGTPLFSSQDITIQVNQSQTNPVCGNNIVEGTEVCDGTALSGKTCQTIGSYTGGTLSCNSNCLSFNTNSCTISTTNPFCLSSDKTTCTQKTSCGTGETSYTTQALCNAQKVTLPPFSIFEPTIPKTIQKSATQAAPPFQVTIKNNGVTSKSTKLETMYVAKSSPKYNFFTGAVGNNFFSFLNVVGVTQISPCQSSENFVQSVQIDSLNPGESKTITLNPDFPSQTSTFADGTSNFDTNGQYLLFVGTYDTCGSGHTGAIAKEIQIVQLNETPINNTKIATQLSVTEKDLETITDVTIVKSICAVTENCLPYTDLKGNSNYTVACQKTAITTDKITTALKTQCKDNFFDLIEFSSSCVYRIILIPLPGGSGAKEACAKASKTFDEVLGGAYAEEIGCQIAISSTGNGMCIAQPLSPQGYSWTSFVTSIGAGLNKAFGGSAKSGISDVALGYTLIVFFIFFAISRK